MVLKEMNMEIIATERWALEDITVRTFARCIAKMEIDDGFFAALESVGLSRMRDVSHWFRINNQFAGHPICEAVRRIIDKDSFNTTGSSEIDIMVPRKVMVTRKVGPKRGELIAKIIEEGIRNIACDPKRELYIPRTIRLSKEWQLNAVQATIKRKTELAVSDGSKMLVAAFTVVDKEGETVISSPIARRATSQRAECFGLIAAMMNTTNVGADPKFIIDTVSNFKKGCFKGTKILKVSNRSLIKKIAYLTETQGASLRWIRGHQDHREERDYALNRAADAAAREAAVHHTPPIIQECWEWADEYAILWKGDLYEGDVRKKIYNIRIKRMIEELESTRTGAAFSRKGCWEEEACRADIMKHNKLIFKMSTDTLPVHSVMERRWPALFAHLKCPLCNQKKESLDHLMNSCEGTQVARAQIWEEVVVYLCAATDLSQESISKKDLRWISRGTKDTNHWYLGKIPEKIGKWIKKRSSGTFTTEIIWNGIRSVILEGVQGIWKIRCEKNAEQGYSWNELLRVEQEWRWLTNWESIDAVDEEIWLEEVTSEEVDELVLENRSDEEEQSE